VVGFLLGYRRSLHNHIARTTLRLDENYLLLPPDADSRRRMITAFLKEAIKKGKLPSGHVLDPEKIEQNGQWGVLQDASFFLGYKDMEAAVARVVYQLATERTVPQLERELLDWGRTTTLRLYNAAFDETEDRDAIKREFLPLVEMATREGKALGETGNPTLDNNPLFKDDKKNGRTAVFAGEADLQEQALGFVKARSLEYDPK
jgi:hypothetical protein